jgi:hypothetical protein
VAEKPGSGAAMGLIPRGDCAAIAAKPKDMGALAGCSQPLGGSTGWMTRCSGPPSATCRLSTATYAVNRHSTPYSSETRTISGSSSCSPMAYRSSSSRR